MEDWVFSFAVSIIDIIIEPTILVIFHNNTEKGEKPRIPNINLNVSDYNSLISVAFFNIMTQMSIRKGIDDII